MMGNKRAVQDERNEVQLLARSQSLLFPNPFATRNETDKLTTEDLINLSINRPIFTLVDPQDKGDGNVM